MEKHKHSFPSSFYWGAATAAHQVEGNNHNQWTKWELETAQQKAAVAAERFSSFPIWESIKDQAIRPETYISGELMDHYHRYEADFDLLTAMHMNAYRFSIEWSRIEPEEGRWNPAEIEHYRQYIAALKRRGIEPMMTLFHFSLPIWFGERGGFEKRANIRYFVRFVEKVMLELGQDIRYFITINEPEVYTEESYLAVHFPPQTRSRWKAWNVFRHLAIAHNRAADVIHAHQPRAQVSIAKNTAHYVAGDNRLITKLFVRWNVYARDDYFLKKVIKHCDFLGVNYYFTNRVVGGRIENLNQRVHDLGWQLAPADIEHVLTRLYGRYKVPIFMTENGLADQADVQRRWWIEETLAGMERAQAKGVPLLGYLHWSLFDNFEWGFGRLPRFGLAAIDYATNERTLRPSAVWFGEVIKQYRRNIKEE
jgi:beta-glucosidase